MYLGEPPRGAARRLAARCPLSVSAATEVNKHQITNKDIKRYGMTGDFISQHTFGNCKPLTTIPVKQFNLLDKATCLNA